MRRHLYVIPFYNLIHQIIIVYDMNGWCIRYARSEAHMILCVQAHGIELNFTVSFVSFLDSGCFQHVYKSYAECVCVCVCKIDAEIELNLIGPVITFGAL